MSKFDEWSRAHNADDLVAFVHDDDALLWLKLKSIMRKEYLAAFLQLHKLDLPSTRLKDQFRELFELLCCEPRAHTWLDEFFRKENERAAGSLPVQQLVSELYKLRVFDWGGNYQNSLDRYLVDRYIKAIPSYDLVTQKLDGEIAESVRGYVLCSWYNHWTSILIEHLFKSHAKVLPTIGMIKKVDFFVDQVPFDLKVTYLPQGYIALRRKELGLTSEVSEWRRLAKQYGIAYDRGADEATQAYEISEKLRDAGSPDADTIWKRRRQILEEAQKSPQLLIRWLYENQGERRFDAANRIFIIASDPGDWDASWKLKRNLELLKPAIDKWLGRFNRKNIEDLKVEFQFDGKDFACYSDAIFVIKN